MRSLIYFLATIYFTGVFFTSDFKWPLNNEILTALSENLKSVVEILLGTVM